MESESHDDDDELRAYYTLEYTNGFGFNTFGANGFMLGLCNDTIPACYRLSADDEFLFSPGANDELRRRSGATSARFDSSYPGNTLELDWKDHRLIEATINACLSMGVSIRLQNTLGAVFNAGEIYDAELEEHKFLDSFDDTCEFYREISDQRSFGCDDNFTRALELYSKYTLAKAWNWKSDRGKRFADRVRDLLTRCHTNDLSPIVRYTIPHYVCFERRHSIRGRYSVSEIHLDEPSVPAPCQPTCNVRVRMDARTRRVSFYTGPKCSVDSTSAPGALVQQEEDDEQEECIHVPVSKRKEQTAKIDDETSNKRRIDSGAISYQLGKIEDIATQLELAKYYEITEDYRDTCMICFDRRADTLVLPCGDSVVCRQCSVALQSTADRQICVRCRRPITMILNDDHGEDQEDDTSEDLEKDYAVTD